MKRIAKFIVKYRVIFAAAFVLLAAVSIYWTTLVKQNYDMSKYLPEDTDTARGVAIMKEEFGVSNNVLLMLTVSEDEVNAMQNKLSAITGVEMVTLDSYKDGKALYIIMLAGDEYSDSAKQALADLRSFVEEEEYELSGSVVSGEGLAQALTKEMPIIMAIAIVIIFLVLLFTSHSWIEPLIFALVLICSVLINMGSNIIFGEISYITYAVSAILQMALAMDYSIILLRSYSQKVDDGMNREDALVEALTVNISPISSSGLTTIAGLVALFFMSLTIGFDIGIVLAKGILISLLSVILFMPALIMLFGKLLEKTKHKPLSLGGKRVAKVSISLRKVLPIVLVLIIAGSYVLQLSNTYSFSGWEMSDGGRVIAQNFGNANQAVLIVDNKYADDYEAQSGFVNALSNLQNEQGNPALKSITAWTTMELDLDMLTAQIGEQDTPFLALVGEDAKVEDLVNLWSSCGGDIYEIEISQKMLATLIGVDESDNLLSLAYGLLKSGDKVTVGSALSKFDALSKNQIVGGLITSKVPQNVQDVIGILSQNREEISPAFCNVVSPLIDEIVNKHGLEAKISDINMGGGSDIFTLINRALFGSDTFKVYEFYTMWNEANGNLADLEITEKTFANISGISLSPALFKLIFSAISSDGKITLMELMQFLSENKDSVMIKEIVDEKIIGVCTIAYSFKDLYLPYINEMIGSVLTQLRSNFVGEQHSRIILTMDLSKDGQMTFEVLDAVKGYANHYFGENNYLAGESMMIKDVSDSFEDDLLKINLITILSIFIIIGLLFRSISLPAILVLVIQGAIWITMAIQSLFGSPIFFMSYVICICILMGATIDYGILISSNFRRNRATMPRYEAIVEAVKTAMPTIMSSGVILITAGFIIGFVSSIMPIYSIGRLLGLGATISILLILLLLPATLYIFDKVISITTWDKIKPFFVKQSENNDSQSA